LTVVFNAVGVAVPYVPNDPAFGAALVAEFGVDVFVPLPFAAAHSVAAFPDAQSHNRNNAAIATRIPKIDF
jgi:hypothetical protein